MKKVLLTIGGSDSGGGAGIQADLRTFKATFDHYGCSVITAITAQNPYKVILAEGMPSHLVRAQLEAIFDAFDVGGIKTGMLWSREIIQVVIDFLKEKKIPLVIDPVMISTSGHALLKPDAIELLKHELLPLADFVTPNLPEAEAFTGGKILTEDDILEALLKLQGFTASKVIIKGGHANDKMVKDYVMIENQLVSIGLPRLDVPTISTHGTGCTFSAALVAAIQNIPDPLDQIIYAKTYVYEAIRSNININESVMQMWTPDVFSTECFIEKRGI